MLRTIYFTTYTKVKHTVKEMLPILYFTMHTMVR